MNKNISNILSINAILKITLIMLLVMTGMTSAQASLQIVTVDVVPDGAGSVQVYKNYGTATHKFMGFVTTTKNFDFDTSDSIAIVPSFNTIGSDYKFVRQCDDVECITGVYVGPLYQDRLTWKITVYYEIPKDGETSQTPIQTPTSTPTSTLHIISLKLSSTTENSITAKVTTTGSGSLGIDLDSKPLVSTINIIKDGESETQLTTTPGEHLICARDVNNNKEIKCQSIELVKPTLSTSSTSSSALSTTQTSNSTVSTTQTSNSTTEKLKTSSDQPKLDDGSLFIDSDPSNAEIYLNDKSYGKTPKIIDIQPGGYILRVTKDGYKDYTKKVIVSESKTEEITVKLIVDESINQSNQSTMMNNGNSKQNNEDTTSLINNMILLAAVVVIAAAAIICVIIYSRKNTYITYMSPQQSTNEKSMIVLKRADDHR